MSRCLPVEAGVEFCKIFAPRREPLLAQWRLLGDHVGVVTASSARGMGDLEQTISEETREVQRLILEQACQTKADLCPPNCPRCGAPLSRVSAKERTVESRFGPIVIGRTHGWCKKCQQWFFPADLVLGLEKNAGASPSVQEAAALAVSKMPVADAQAVIERLTGMQISRSTLDREARRQGEKARQLRDKMDEKALDTQGRWELTDPLRSELGAKPFTLVIEMDAWNIGERDEWGRTAQIGSVGRWHWVYGATVFRLCDRLDKNDRKMIVSRGYVMTRQGSEALVTQVYAEAVRHGLLLAKDVLVIADGAVWIWKIAQGRFPSARTRLDFYHASEHLWAVANELYGQGSNEARTWVEPLLHKLKHGQELTVLQTLEDLKQTVKHSQLSVVEREANYFHSHRNRLNYKSGIDAGEPIGSGAMESTCRQFQCRFKRPGQFWSTKGDEALMALECLWRNERWHLLFPHNAHLDPTRN